MSDTSRVDPGVVVDIHAHAVPSELLGRDRRLRFGTRWTSTAPDALTDLAARLAEMDRTGVAVQVVSPWIELSPDELEPAGRTAFLRLLNDGMAGLAASRPDRLRALALLDRHDPAAAAAELVRTAAHPGVVGAELAAGGSAVPLHDPAWDRLWAAASTCGSFILLHPWRAGSPAGINGFRLGDIVDNPAQSTAVVGAMIMAGVLDRFPDLRLCVVHGGGFLPYQAGRFDALVGGSGRRLRRLYYDSLTHSPETLSWLVSFAGSDRVLLGSDYPFPTGDAEAVRSVERAGLTESDRAAVLGATACRLFSTP